MDGALELKKLENFAKQKTPQKSHNRITRVITYSSLSFFRIFLLASFHFSVFGTFSCKASLCLLTCFNLRIALRRKKDVTEKFGTRLREFFPSFVATTCFCVGWFHGPATGWPSVRFFIFIHSEIHKPVVSKNFHFVASKINQTTSEFCA